MSGARRANWRRRGGNGHSRCVEPSLQWLHVCYCAFGCLVHLDGTTHAVNWFGLFVSCFSLLLVPRHCTERKSITYPHACSIVVKCACALAATAARTVRERGHGCRVVRSRGAGSALADSAGVGGRQGVQHSVHGACGHHSQPVHARHVAPKRRFRGGAVATPVEAPGAQCHSACVPDTTTADCGIGGLV